MAETPWDLDTSSGPTAVADVLAKLPFSEWVAPYETDTAGREAKDTPINVMPQLGGVYTATGPTEGLQDSEPQILVDPTCTDGATESKTMQATATPQPTRKKYRV